MAGVPDDEVVACRKPKKLSLAEEESIRATISLANRAAFFAKSTCPVTPESERELEQVRAAVHQFA